MTSFLNRAASTAGYVCQAPCKAWEMINSLAREVDQKDAKAKRYSQMNGGYNHIFNIPIPSGILVKTVSIAALFFAIECALSKISESTGVCPSHERVFCMLIDQSLPITGSACFGSLYFFILKQILNELPKENPDKAKALSV